MTSKIYSQYDNLHDYTKTVGTLCSLLLRNDICTSEQIEDILSTSKIFESIELEHNPLLATSDENVWFPLLFREKKFCNTFDENAQYKLLNAEKEALSIDWLSMWAGYIIASTAIRYDIRMKDVLDIMSFEEFLGFSVANHAQPENRMYAIFAKRSKGKYRAPSDDMLKIIDSPLCIIDADTSQKLIECIGISDIAEKMQDKSIIAAMKGTDIFGLLGCLGAMNIESKNINVFLGEPNNPLNVPTTFTNTTADSNDYEIIQFPNTFGAWGKRRLLLQGKDELDKVKYLRYMMPNLLLINSKWIDENVTKTDIVSCSPDILADAAKTLANEASAYMTIPLR